MFMDITHDLLFLACLMEHQTSSTVDYCKAHNDTTEAGMKAESSRYCQGTRSGLA